MMLIMYLGATMPSIPPGVPFGSRSDSQIPERSTRPSGVRGVGAARSGLPSAVRGSPRVGWFTH